MRMADDFQEPVDQVKDAIAQGNVDWKHSKEMAVLCVSRVLESGLHNKCIPSALGIINGGDCLITWTGADGGKFFSRLRKKENS